MEVDVIGDVVVKKEKPKKKDKFIDNKPKSKNTLLSFDEDLHDGNLNFASLLSNGILNHHFFQKTEKFFK